MADDLPEGFVIDQEGMTPAPERQRVQLPPGYGESYGNVPSGIGQIPQGAAWPGSDTLPEGFVVDDHGTHGNEHGGTVTGLVKQREPIGRAESIVRGIGDQPIVGPLLTRAEAFKNALVEPFHKDEKDISHADSLGKRMSENYEAENARTAEAYKQFPVSTNAANIGTTAVGGAPVAGTKIGATLLGLIGKTLPQRLAAGAASGAGINAIDAQLRGNDPVKAAEWGAGLGAVAPALARPVGAVLNRMAESAALRNPEIVAARQEAARQAATPQGTVVPKQMSNLVDERGQLTHDFLDHSIDNQYDWLNRSATAIKPDAVVDGINGIRNNLKFQGFDPELFKNVHGILDTLESRAQQGAVSFNDVRAFQRALKAIRGPMADNETKAAAGYASSGLDDMLQNLHPQKDIIGGNVQENISRLRNVNADYRTKKQIERLQLADELAQSGAQVNPAGNMRTQIRVILRENTRGKLNLPSETVALLQKAASAGPTSLAAKFAPQQHLSALGELGSAAAGFPGAGLAAAAGGYAARALDNQKVRSLFGQAIESLMNRSPSVQRFNQALPPLVHKGLLAQAARVAPAAIQLRANTTAQQLGQQQ